MMIPSNLWSVTIAFSVSVIVSQQAFSPMLGTGMIYSGTFVTLFGGLKIRLLASIASEVILGIFAPLFLGIACFFESEDSKVSGL